MEDELTGDGGLLGLCPDAGEPGESILKASISQNLKSTICRKRGNPVKLSKTNANNFNYSQSIRMLRNSKAIF